MKTMHKKGVLENLGALAKGAIVALVTIVVGFLIASQVRTQVINNDVAGVATNCSNSVACNATDTMMAATATIPTWVGLIILVAIAGLIMYMVNRFK